MNKNEAWIKESLDQFNRGDVTAHNLIDVEEERQMTHDEYCAYMKELNRINKQFEPKRKTDHILNQMEELRIMKERKEAKELEDFLNGFAKKG